MGAVLAIPFLAAAAVIAERLFSKPPRARPVNLNLAVIRLSKPHVKESRPPQVKEGSLEDRKGRVALTGGRGSRVALRDGGGRRVVEESPPDSRVKPEDIIEEARQELGVDCIKHYNFAVTGQSGVGKSSFVNAFLSLEGNACAPVGEVETTHEVRSYSCQKWPSLKLWDIPGAGTTKHPAATYFEDKKLYLFDAILILTADRFLDVDFQILRSARSFNTPCVFVRTKCDLAVESRAKRDKVNALEASQRFRAEVTRSFQEGLANAGFIAAGGSSSESTPHLYFISNKLLEDEDAYSIYDRKTKAVDCSLSCMDEQALITFLLDAAKIRA